MTKLALDLNRYRKVYPYLRVKRVLNVTDSPKTVTTSYTLANEDYIILVNATAVVTMSLPSSQLENGDTFVIKDISGNISGTNTIVVSGNGLNIDSESVYKMKTNFQSSIFVYADTVWRVI